MDKGIDAGYTIDFRGTTAMASIGGPTFRSITFTRDGFFEQSRTSITDVPVNVGGTSITVTGDSNMTGSYSITGNTIEPRYNSGQIERSLFGTDGTNTVILDQVRYTAS